MIRLFASLLVTLYLFLPARAETVWHFPTPISASAFVTKQHVKFAQRVELETNGELKMIVHPAGSLFKTADILRAVRTGQVPMGSTGLFMHAAEEPMFALTNLPFLVRNLDEAKRLISLSRPSLEAALEKRNLKLLYRAIWTPHGLFSKRALQTPADLVGMRLRTYDLATTRIAQLAGGIPTKTESSEIALAFSTNVVEGSFNSGVTGMSQKLWDYIDYYYTINYALPTSTVFVNLDAWRALDASTQATVLQLAGETEREVWAEMSAMEQSLNSAMRQAGMTVQDVPPELAAHFEKIGRQISEEWIKRAGPEGESIINRLKDL